MLTASAVAYELGVSDQKISRLCQSGRVPGAIRRRAAWAIPAEALPLIRDLLEQPVVRQPKPKPAPAPAKSEPAPVGMMTPPEAALALGVTPGYICHLAARGLAPGARKGAHPSHRNNTWLFPPESLVSLRRYLDAPYGAREAVAAEIIGGQQVGEVRFADLKFIHAPGDQGLAEQVWAWHRAGRP